MAYNPKNLSVLAYANGFTLWHYTTPDVASDANTAGYFNGAADMLRAGDMILSNVDTNGANPGAGIFLVNHCGGGVVDAANITSIGSSDTD